MSEHKKDPAEGWTHEGDGVWVPPLRQSEGAVPKSAGPAGSLRCDGVVGLRVESAEAFYRWLLDKAKEMRADSTTIWDADVAESLADDFGRQMGLTNPRQPESNS